MKKSNQIECRPENARKRTVRRAKANRERERERERETSAWALGPASRRPKKWGSENNRRPLLDPKSGRDHRLIVIEDAGQDWAAQKGSESAKDNAVSCYLHTSESVCVCVCVCVFVCVCV